MKYAQLAGKTAYALLFLLVIPAGQWFWAAELEDIVRYPAVKSQTAGIIIGVLGLLLIGWGMFSLKKFGKGLPMNAYPPPVFVTQGPYRYLEHPIYWGYGLLMISVSVYTGSAAGLWIVTPITVLGIIALVWGYEERDLRERFNTRGTAVLLDIPAPSAAPAVLSNRLACFLWVFISLAVSNFIVFVNTWRFTPSPAWNASPGLSFIHINGWLMQIITWAFILLLPFIIKVRKNLRSWTISMLGGIALSVFLSLLYPPVAAQYFHPSYPVSVLSDLRIVFTTPVFLILISAWAYFKEFGKWGPLLGAAAFMLAVAELKNTPAFYQNALVSFIIFLAAAGYSVAWSFMRNAAEAIANSWKEWTIGPVRIINHGIYAGLGAFGGILFCGFLTGSSYAWAILLFAVVVTICAALWAQVIEGSDKLKRPFGFYGALAGVLIAGCLLWLMGYDAWLLIGVISVVMPWVQAAGRFRCLVNGCCHGKPTGNAALGICFHHPRSRVCTISGLKGKYLHPTQLYSILWLLPVGFILLALWQNHFSYTFIFGMYLILTGVGRFVEEAFRGEVQTPVWKGLRLYQWAAVISVLAGIFFTVPDTHPVFPQPVYGWQTWASAMAGGFFVFFAMGVDFPRSNSRFSRLV